MIIESIFVGVLGLVVGLVVAWIFVKLGLHLPTKERRNMKKIIKDPHRLADELNKHGDLYDFGEKLKYSVGDRNGKPILEVERTPEVKEKTPEAPEPIGGGDKEEGEPGVEEIDEPESEKMVVLARCMKCREQKPVGEAYLDRSKNGGFMIKGKCLVCGCGLCRIVSKADAERFVDES